MTNVNFFLGYPVEFENLCLVYPPKVKDVVTTKNYDIYLRILTLSQEEIEDEWTRAGLDLTTLLNPFEYILNNAFNNPEVRMYVEKAFEFFIHEPATFLFEEKQIILGELKNLSSLKDLRILNEEKYFDFQNLIREACGLPTVDRPNLDEDPRVKAIKAKARYRDKIKAKQGKSLKLITLLASICYTNLGLNPLNIGELSYAAIPVLLNTYQEKEKYEIDVDSLLAGADSKKVKPKYWIRNLDEK